MVSLDKLPRDRDVPYLGWYLETAPEFLETYVCHAWEDQGDGAFSVRARALSTDPDALARFEASRLLALGLAKGKVFLATWEQGVQYGNEEAIQRTVPTPLLRRLVLQGLHRLYERGFGEGDFQIDLDGVALELGVKRELVDRAVDFLYEAGHIGDYGTFGRHRGTGDIWLTHQGAGFLESQGLGVDMFLQQVYDSTLGKLFSVRTELAESLEALRERASSPATSRQEIVGFASMIRDFVQALTDDLHQRMDPAEPLPREQTINKVRAITAIATSETSRDHVRALSEVVVTHWQRLNDVQQKAIHEGSVEVQRLFAYTLLFTADLLDVAADFGNS